MRCCAAPCAYRIALHEAILHRVAKVFLCGGSSDWTSKRLTMNAYRNTDDDAHATTAGAVESDQLAAAGGPLQLGSTAPRRSSGAAGRRRAFSPSLKTR